MFSEDEENKKEAQPGIADSEIERRGRSKESGREKSAAELEREAEELEDEEDESPMEKLLKAISGHI